MEQKKSPKARLESNSPVYFAMGVILALSSLLVAFEWSSEAKVSDLYVPAGPLNEVQEIDITVREPKPPKPQIELPKVVAPEELIVTNEKVEQPDIMSTEITNSEPDIIYVPPMPTPRKDEAVIDFAEIMPSFKGGTSALTKFLNETIKYPVISIEQHEQGRVICTFVVERDGSITDIQVLRGVSPTLDKEAMRVIKEMPAWNPGIQNGDHVRVKLTLPIVFRLSNS